MVKKVKIKKGGRPKKEGPRHPCGQLVDQRDTGTDQLRAQRRRATGRDDVAHDFPLEVARAREILTDRQAEAGWRYAALYWACFGYPQGGSGVYRKLLSGVLSGGPVSVPGETAGPKQRAALEEATAVLSRIGASLPRRVASLCCHFDATELARDAQGMRDALSALDQLFCAGKGKKRRSEANNESRAA